MLMPAKMKWRKHQKGKMRGKAYSGSSLAFGDFGLKAASEAVQIFGGYGYIHDYPIEKFLRDAKLSQIGGGTSEVQRFIISRILSFL